MQAVMPYLNFKGNAEEAFEFYRSVFGGELLGIMRFADFGEGGMGVSEADRDKVAHIALPLLEGVNLMASDVVGPQAESFNPGNNTYIYLELDSSEEADKLFAGLSEGGRVEMPLQTTGWAEKYGTCVDKFGIQWMMSYTGDVKFTL